MRAVEDLILAAVFFGAIVLVSYGSWLIYAPAGFIVAGVLLFATVILYVRGGE